MRVGRAGCLLLPAFCLATPLHEASRAMAEGYVLHSYGAERYLRHAVASAVTLRRHDTERPVALFCPPAHQQALQRRGLFDGGGSGSALFDRVETLPEEARSITGFKHRLHQFALFDRTLFADADMVWCRNPDPLWAQLSGYAFTATGKERADFWFGGPKGPAIVLDYLLDRRRRTLRHFGLTHLPRVQAGLIYVRDADLAQQVCTQAAAYLRRAGETHFRSRLAEANRSEETCEWSLAMAVSARDLDVVPWQQGHRSPQLGFVEDYVAYDADFHDVQCRYYSDPRIHELRGFPGPAWLRDGLIAALAALPGRGDHMEVVPFALHFSWAHEKQPFLDFAERVWQSPSGEGEKRSR